MYTIFKSRNLAIFYNVKGRGREHPIRSNVKKNNLHAVTLFYIENQDFNT